MDRFISLFDIISFDGQQAHRIKDKIIQEVTAEIFLNNTRIIKIACAGQYLEELGVGYLRAEGLISSSHEIKNISVSVGENPQINIFTHVNIDKTQTSENEKTTIMSSGARRKSTIIVNEVLLSEITIPVHTALNIMESLLVSSYLHEETRGAHCSALANADGIIIHRDDIGRHNTFDMLGGYLLLNNLRTDDKIIATTGRVSCEIVGKVYTLKTPIIISHAVPTAQAIEFARKAGITIIGYVRNGKLKVYSEEKRVIF